MTDTEIARRNTAYDDETLSQIDSFEAAVALVSANYGKGELIEQVADYGTGFMVLVDNSKLIGVPFVIVQWAFNEGDFGLFASAEIVTKSPITDNGITGSKWIVNDGSTGIFRQLQSVTHARTRAGRADTHAGLAVPRGLTKTEYFFNEDTKETAARPGEGKGWKPASTHYLAQ